MCVGTSAHEPCVPVPLPHDRRLPQPGQGPSRDMLNGFWKHKMIGFTEAGPGETPQVCVSVCVGGLEAAVLSV